MADTPSSILLLRLQSTGSNTNLWGGYLNTALSTQERATKGYQTLAVTGDATISWSNYSASNTGAVARLKLTGPLAAAATLTFPAYENYVSVENAAGAAVTIKCSGGTGVTIANGGKQLIYCDGTDYYSASPNVLGTGTVTVSGRIAGVTAGTASTDAVNKTQMETAIATAGLPATAGTVLVSSNDTTAGYIGTKINATGSGAATVTQSVGSGGGDETVDISVAVLAGGYADGGEYDTGTTIAAGSSYMFTSACVICLPSAPSDGAKSQLALFDRDAAYTLNPNGKKINNSTSNLEIPGGQTLEITYNDTLGDWE